MRTNQSLLSFRRAFTALDLLVAVAGLLLLTGLLLPAVQKVRAVDARTHCQNNLKQLGRAFTSFADDNQGFPARRTGFDGGNKVKGGWGLLLLPYLDEKLAKAYHSDYDYYDPINKTIVETPVNVFLCPASPGDRTVTVKAKATGNSLNADKDTDFVVKGASIDYISSNGFGMPTTGYGFNWPAEVSGNRHQAMDDDMYLPRSRITDGLSSTALIVEQAARPQIWRLGTQVKNAREGDMGGNSRGAWAGFGSIAFRPADRTDGYSPGKGTTKDCSVNCNNGQGIYGFHTGGANILMCDGSVRFVSESLSGLTFGQLTTRDDGQLLDATDF